LTLLLKWWSTSENDWCKSEKLFLQFLCITLSESQPMFHCQIVIKPNKIIDTLNKSTLKLLSSKYKRNIVLSLKLQFLSQVGCYTIPNKTQNIINRSINLGVLKGRRHLVVFIIWNISPNNIIVIKNVSKILIKEIFYKLKTY